MPKLKTSSSFFYCNGVLRIVLVAVFVGPFYVNLGETGLMNLEFYKSWIVIFCR
jgi:hypothetical protein